MDEDLKKILDDAHTAGASEEQLQNIVDLYKKKKQSAATPVPQAPVVEKTRDTPSNFGDGNLPSTLSPYIKAPDSRSIVDDSINSDGTQNEFITPDKPASQVPVSWNEGIQAFTDGVSHGFDYGAIPFNQGLNDVIIKPLAGAESALARTYSKVTGEKRPSWLSGINDISNFYQKAYDERDQPESVIGKSLAGFAENVPLMGATALTGAGSTAAAGISNLTKIFAVKGALSSFKDATDAGLDIQHSLDESGKGFLKEGVAGLTLEAQMMVGGALGKGVSNELAKFGLLAGKTTPQLLKAFAVGSVMAGTSAAQDVVDGKDFDWDRAVQQFASILPFEASGVIEAGGEDLHNYISKRAINKSSVAGAYNAIAAKNINDAGVLRNLMGFSTDEIKKINENPMTADHLYALSLDKGVQAFDAKDLDEKKNLHFQQLSLKNQADIKFATDKIAANSGAFTDGINESSFPEGDKQHLLDKIDFINKNYNPTEVTKTDLSEKVQTANNQVTDIRNDISQNTNPVDRQEGFVKMNDAIAEKVEAQSKLFDITNDQSNKEAEIQQESEIKANDLAVPATADELPKREDTNDLPVKKPVSINNDYLENAHIVDVKPNGEVVIRQQDGSEETLTDKERKALDITDQHLKEFDADIDLTKTETKLEPSPDKTDNEPRDGESEFDHKVRTSNNPDELATMYSDHIDDLKNNLGVPGAIADYNGRFSREDFDKWGDKNHISPAIARNYFERKGEYHLGLDAQAMEINDNYFNGQDIVQPGDIVQFALDHPAGHNSYFTPAGSDKLKAINDRYREITGKNLRKDVARRLAEKYSVSNQTAHDFEADIESPKLDKVLDERLGQLIHNNGMLTGEADYSKIEDELELYIKDPSNFFNIFDSVFDSKAPTDEQIEKVKEIINERKQQQESESERPDQGSASGSENSDTQPEEDRPEGEENRPDGEEEPELEPEESQAQLENPADKKATPELIDQMKKVMADTFPNIETRYYDTVEEFNNAAKVAGLERYVENGTSVNGFVDSDKVIHFNPEAITNDTQLHEQGHVLTNWASHYSPELYNRMLEVGKSMEVLHQELKDAGYDKSGNALFEEAFVTALGRDAQSRLKELLPDTYQRGKLQKFLSQAWNKLERWIEAKTGYVLSAGKNIQDMGMEDFIRHVGDKYLLSANKVSDISSSELASKSADDAQAQVSRQKPVRGDGEGLKEFAQRVADWKDAIAKEPEPESNIKPGYDDIKQTSIKNKVTKAERESRGMLKVELLARRKFPVVWEQAKRMVDSGEVDPRALAESLVKDPRPLKAEETAALTYDRMRLYNDHKNIMEHISKAVEDGDAGKEAELRIQLAYNEDATNTNDIADVRVGYEQGLGLSIRQIITNEDYSLENQLQVMRTANAGEALSPELRLKLENISKELDAAQKKLADYENGKSVKQAEIFLKKEKEQAKRESRKADYGAKKSRLKSERKNILDELHRLARNQRKNLNSGFNPEMLPLMAKLARNYIQDGITTVSELVDNVYDDLKDHMENLSKRDVRDALSGYGRTIKSDTDADSKQLRELKSQARLVSALEDANSGKRPEKSGLQREKPSDEVRELQKKVAQAMRENGIEIEHTQRSEEDQWRSALDAVKSRLRNQIVDLNKQIETGERSHKKVGVAYDQEANDLKAERDRLKEAVEAVEGKSEMSPEQRVSIATKAVERSIQEYERRIAEKDLTPKEKTSKTPETPELSALRDKLSKLRDHYKEIKDAATPKKTPAEAALESYKTRLQNKITDLNERMAVGNYESEPKKPALPLDREAMNLQENVKTIQGKFDIEKEKLRLQNRSTLEKRLDFFTGFRRAVLLSNFTTLIKLSTAATARILVTPLEEMAGEVISRVPLLSRVSAKAPREGGGFNSAAEAKAITNIFRKETFEDMKNTVKTGRSQITTLHGHDKPAPQSWMDIFGNIHSALKIPAKNNEFWRAYEKRSAFALKNGVDVLDPLVEAEISTQAYKDAERSIFLQENFATKAFNAGVKYLEDGGGDTGKISAAALKFLFPIIKVPTNFVAETSSYAFGGVKAALALRKGIEALNPDQADYVMRNLKKQSLGAFALALGFYGYKHIGGFSQEDDKRKKSDAKPKDLIIAGVHVPHFMQDAPVFNVLQMGATYRRVYNKYSHKRHSDPNLEATFATAKGLYSEVPFFSEIGSLTSAFKNTDNLSGAAGEITKSLVLPGDVQRIAQMMDEDSSGNTNKRKAKGFIQHIETGVPGLRNHLKRKR